MLADTVMRVTGQQSAKAAWLALVKPTDIVGLVPTPHLNPTHPELIDAVAARARWRRCSRAADPRGAGRHRPAARVHGAHRAARPQGALADRHRHRAEGSTSCSPAGRGTYHDANNANLGEIWLLPDVKGKTRLVLVDALRPLCDKGPQPDPRYFWDYKGLIASTDPVAVDTVGLQIIMAKRRALRGEPWPLSPPPLCVAWRTRSSASARAG